MDTNDFNFFEFKGCKEDECTNKVTNIFGRNVCRVFGKLRCENCEHRSPSFFFGIWKINISDSESVYVSQKPVKSSLGYLYGYPTKITYKEPKFLKLRRQGTISTRWPGSKW